MGDFKSEEHLGVEELARAAGQFILSFLLRYRYAKGFLKELKI